MSDHNKASEPAFPVPDRQWPAGDNGMSLRDYFAAKAMQALIQSLNPGAVFSEQVTSGDAYRIADAMLKEREK